MQYLSASGRTFVSEILCLRDENEFLHGELNKCKLVLFENSSCNEGLLLLQNTSLNWENVEKNIIGMALKKHDNNRHKAASELGFSDRTMYRKLIEYKIK